MVGVDINGCSCASILCPWPGLNVFPRPIQIYAGQRAHTDPSRAIGNHGTVGRKVEKDFASLFIIDWSLANPQHAEEATRVITNPEVGMVTAGSCLGSGVACRGDLCPRPLWMAVLLPPPYLNKALYGSNLCEAVSAVTASASPLKGAFSGSSFPGECDPHPQVGNQCNNINQFYVESIKQVI